MFSDTENNEREREKEWKHRKKLFRSGLIHILRSFSYTFIEVPLYSFHIPTNHGVLGLSVILCSSLYFKVTLINMTLINLRLMYVLLHYNIRWSKRFTFF